MPCYDFSCPACGARFEAQVSFGEFPICPACGAGHTERLLSPFAIGSSIRPRGLAARRSDAGRRVREEQRNERREQRRSQRDQG